MTETSANADTAAPVPVPVPVPERRYLPAIVRYPVIVACGASVAALASYLLRTVGF